MKAGESLALNGDRESCALLRDDLDLYAEGELRDPSSLFRVKRHLEACPSCQDYLADYDELTRAILSSGHPQPSWGRAGRIFEMIESLEGSRSPCGFQPRGFEVSEPRGEEVPGKSSSAFRLRFALYAAASVLLVSLLSAYASYFWPGSGGSDLGPPCNGVGSYSLAISSPSLDTARSAAVSQAPSGQGGGLHWVLDREQGPLNPGSQDDPLRLYGFRPLSCPLASNPSDVERVESFEWVVDAVLSGRQRLLPSDKFFLVPEEEGKAEALKDAIEIDPVAWFEASKAREAAGRPELSPRPKRRGKTTVYRVFVIRSQVIRPIGPAFPPEHRAPFFPVLEGRGSGSRPWIFPNSWQN